MGFGRRIVRKSVRKATPRSVRKVAHPVRTATNAVTPRPVKQASRAVYTVAHPIGATENKMIGSALGGGTSRRRSSSASKGGGSGLVLVGIVGVAILVAIAFWYITIPLLLLAALWFFWPRLTVRRRTQKARLAAEEAHRVWLASPPPPLQVPIRITQHWLEENVPALHPGQIPMLIDHMRSRHWSEDKIRSRLAPFGVLP